MNPDIKLHLSSVGRVTQSAILNLTAEQWNAGVAMALTGLSHFCKRYNRLTSFMLKLCVICR